LLEFGFDVVAVEPSPVLGERGGRGRRQVGVAVSLILGILAVNGRAREAMIYALDLGL
jgi:hypothetical protein